MLLRATDINYLSALHDALEAGRVPSDSITAICSECREVQGILDNEGHVVLKAANTPDHNEDDVVVAIGCEGYHVVNPNLLGIDAPDWQDWTRSPTEMTTRELRAGDKVIMDDEQFTVAEVRELSDGVDVFLVDAEGRTTVVGVFVADFNEITWELVSRGNEQGDPSAR